MNANRSPPLLYSMESVRFIKRSTVQAATHKETSQRIELTPWDLRMLLIEPSQKGLLFHKPTDKNSNTLIHHLENSLSLTLDHFFPLAGRCVRTENAQDNTISFSIECNNAGVEFVHAAADGVTMDDILNPVYIPRFVHSFFALNGIRNCEISKPLLGIQVTELRDGVFIGCTFNHAAADGTSFWHFFNCWSEIARGASEKLTSPPYLVRWFHEETECPVRLPRNDLFFKRVEFNPPPLKERVFHFTKEKIAILKANANLEIGTSDKINKISSLQALLSHIWRSVTRVRRLEADVEVTYRLQIGTRPRMQPPLPSQYFGNATYGTGLNVKAGELLQHGLGYAALLMNEMVASQTYEAVTKYYVSWAKNPKLLTMDGFYSKNCLATGSSPWFNVYGNDFGWGRPVAVRSGAANKFDGILTLYPGVEQGSVDIEVCLLAETLKALGDDVEFMEAVTVSSLH